MLTWDNIGKLPYTLKEIVEMKYPEFWEGAGECIKIADKMQAVVLDLLPHYRKLLPGNFEQLKAGERTQKLFLNYIKLRCAYGLAHKVWKMMDDGCRDLARAANNPEDGDIEHAKGMLIAGMSLVESLIDADGFETVIGNDDIGFAKLEELVDGYDAPNGCRLDFVVFPPYGLYSDIKGIIADYGVLNDWLWETATEGVDPTEPNIAGLMERPEDNETVRMY